MARNKPPPSDRSEGDDEEKPPSDLDDVEVAQEEKPADETAQNEKPSGIRGASVTPASQKTTADPTATAVGTRTGSTTKETSVAETKTEASTVDVPKEIAVSDDKSEVTLSKTGGGTHSLEEREKVRKELAEMQETLNQWALEYGINLKRIPDIDEPAPEPPTPPPETPKAAPPSPDGRIPRKPAATPTSLSTPLSPASHYQQVSSNVKNQTLADIRLEEYRTKGITPVWNGRKETFWLFRMNAQLHRNNAIWSALTIIKVQGETVDVIMNPFQVTTQFLTQISPYFHEHPHPTPAHLESKENLRIMSLFLQNSLEPKFLHQMLGIVNPTMHLDGRVLWVSMVQEVFGTRLQYAEGWMDHVKNAHPSKYNNDFVKYKADVENHLQLMTAASIDTQPLARHIIKQLANWNVPAFTQAINSVSLTALEANWDCMKVLAEAKKFYDHFSSLNQWTPVPTDFAAMLASASNRSLLAKAATHFEASKKASSTGRKHGVARDTHPMDRDANRWKFNAPSNPDSSMDKFGKTWWFCTKCDPPRYSLHKTSEHREDFGSQPSKKRKGKDRKPKANLAAAGLTQENIQALQQMACFLAGQHQGVQEDTQAQSANTSESTEGKKPKKLTRKKGGDGK